MNSLPERKTCAICLGSLEAGQGRALFTAECSHSFHFGCIANNVTHGNHVCPICRAIWNNLPFVMPNTNIPNPSFSFQHPQRPNPSFPFQQHPQHRIQPGFSQEPIHFSDDEPLLTVTNDQASSASLQNVGIKAIPERTAVGASESVSQFAVLVILKAPSLPEDGHQIQRAPIDLITVLDVSGSMHGSKLALLKRAMNFVIDNMGPSDRLSIVCFATHARRIFPLKRMNESGREAAKRAVISLGATGSTNIVEGLKKGIQVLEERRQRNPVASIIFLSDGQDTCHGLSNQRQPPPYLHLLPNSIRPTNLRGDVGQIFPVHAFGFGVDHDPLAMHSIADASGGTFSFIESYEMVQDAFASCIGGLLSVVTQDLRMVVRSASHGVEIKSIPSGRHASEISDQGHQGRLNIGDLYADEEKEFLINVSVPTLVNEGKTSLLDIVCTYRDVVSKQMVQIEGDLVEILRPKILSSSDMIVNMQVDRQRNRLNAMETIAEAQRIAETGDLSSAKSLLSSRRTNLLASASAQAGDNLCTWLEAEMKETEERMGNMQIYESRGRAFALSNISAHANQRATTRGSMTFGCASASLGAYATASMSNMVKKSQKSNSNPKRDDDLMQE